MRSYSIFFINNSWVQCNDNNYCLINFQLSKSNSNPLTSSSRQSYMLAQENPVMMPSFLHSPDWSGVPAFKVNTKPYATQVYI